MSIRYSNHNIRRAPCTSHAADLRLQRNRVKLHSLGPHVLYMLFLELGAGTLKMTAIEATVARYAYLDPELLRLFGPDRFPPSVWEVPT